MFFSQLLLQGPAFYQYDLNNYIQAILKIKTCDFPLMNIILYGFEFIYILDSMLLMNRSMIQLYLNLISLLISASTVHNET